MLAGSVFCSYANIEVHEAQKYVEELLKTIQEQTGSAIVQKKEERYSFVEITD